MTTSNASVKTVIVVNAQYWDSIHRDIRDAIDLLNKVTSRIAAHETNGVWELCDVVDYADRKLRDARKLLENIEAPI
jgi:hypothetical protein